MEMKYYAMKFNLKEMKIPPISQFPRYFGGVTVGTIYRLIRKRQPIFTGFQTLK